MAIIEINRHPSKRELKQFAWLWFPLFFVLVGTLGWWKFRLPAVTFTCLGLGGTVALLGFVSLPTVRYFYLAWMYAAFPLGWLLSHVMLGLIFFGIITPIGWVMRLFGRDPLDRRFESSASTYWVPYKSSHDIESYFRQF